MATTREVTHGVGEAFTSAPGAVFGAIGAVLDAPALGGACVALGIVGLVTSLSWLPILCPLFLVLLMVGMAISWASHGLIPSSEAEAREIAWWGRELPAGWPSADMVSHATGLACEYPDSLTAREAILAYFRGDLEDDALERKLSIAAKLVDDLLPDEEEEYDRLASVEARRIVWPKKGTTPTTSRHGLCREIYDSAVDRAMLGYGYDKWEE